MTELRKNNQISGIEGVDRKLLLFSACLLIVGAFFYNIITPLFHPGPPLSAGDEVVFNEYANSTDWTFVHALQFLGDGLIAFGLMTLYSALNVKSGIIGQVGRFALYSSIASLAFFAVVFAVDGIALRYAIDAWTNAQPSSDQTAYFAVAQGIRGVEWAARGYSDYFTGLTLALYAAVIVVTARISRPIGFLMALLGVAYMARGYTYGMSYVVNNEAITIYVLIPGILIWTVWLFVLAYRMKRKSVHGSVPPTEM
ncbi:MAG TPA: hypothetical protein VJP79_09960 [Nitrososphaera sp.]|nr:hypothetical protein [Nitrososphaera sp.]